MTFTTTPRLWALAAVCLTAAQSAVAAPDLSLEVSHRIVALSPDGTKRTAEFSETIDRQSNTVWVARVIPPGFHRDDEHKSSPGKSHKHADLSSATRWISRDKDGKLKLKLVAAHDKVIVEVAQAEFNTVGFDGSWAAAYHLIDPTVLKKLDPAEKQGDLQWYQTKGSKTPDLRILWNPTLEIPIKVETRNAQGTSFRSTSVKVLSQSTKAPWNNLKGFATKDYSDFLD